jgi:diguanylate cyclase (GGDEF)-like protein/PAS domain S-box-containing protein
MQALVGRLTDGRERQHPGEARLPAGLTVLFIIGASLFVASALDLLAAGTLWSHLLRVAAAGFGTAIAARGSWVGQGRERRVRLWIALALAVWLLSEGGRLLLSALSLPPPDGLDPTILVLGLVGAATYVLAAHGRMRASDEAALYLDALIIFATMMAVMLVVGGSLVSEPLGLNFLLHAGFFLAMLGATAILALATRVPIRLHSQYMLLVGLLFGGIGYLGLIFFPVRHGVGDAILHATLALGSVMVGYGGLHWTADEEANPRFAVLSDRLRDALPMAAVAVAPLLMVILAIDEGAYAGPMRMPAAATVALVVLLAVVRQTILLRDREQSIDRERRLRDELAVTEAQYRSVVERVQGVVYVAEVGVGARWHYVSHSISDLLGFTPEEWLADPDAWERQIHPGDRERMMLAEQSSHDPAYNGSRWEYRLIARDGREVWVLDDEVVIARDGAGHPTMVQGILLDINDRKGLEDQLRHQALHDPLTGLPNRSLFVDRVNHALVRRASRLRVAVLFLDLDDFKTINDSLGHAVGDELLIRVAERLTAVLRPEDTACRLGGDEFAVLLEETGADAAVGAAQRALDALKPAFAIGGRDVQLRGSIGVAVRTDTEETAADLLRDADTAMYAAKALGKGSISLFKRGMEQPVRRRLEMRNTLETGLERGELFLEYQPVIDMATDQLVGVEGLVRWRHPQLGLLMPTDFLPLAEEMGLIGRIGEWVLGTACADLRRHADPRLTASINVSAHQLGHGLLRDQVERVLARTGVEPSRLVVELTEGTLAAAGEGAEVELQQVHELGVRIALDDFGSGYSSLEYLGRLPIDVLKIDRSLVARVDSEPQRQGVLRALRRVATDLGLDTIVEGVERPEQRLVLLELGFQHAQGFLFSRPVPLAEALAYGGVDAPVAATA